jgi:hypothetical protein
MKKILLCSNRSPIEKPVSTNDTGFFVSLNLGISIPLFMIETIRINIEIVFV